MCDGMEKNSLVTKVLAEAYRVFELPVFKEWLRFRARAAYRLNPRWRQIHQVKIQQVSFLDLAAEWRARWN